MVRLLTFAFCVGLTAAAAGPAFSQGLPRSAMPRNLDLPPAPEDATFLVERAELSPNGQVIGYIAGWGGQRRMRVQNLVTGEGETLDMAGIEPRDLIWAGDDHLLLTVLRQPLEGEPRDNGLFSVVSYNTRSDSFETVINDRTDVATIGRLTATRLPRQPKVVPIVFERPTIRTIDGEAEVFTTTLNFDGSCRYELTRLELDTGSARFVGQGVQRTHAIVVGPDGRRLAVVKDGQLLMAVGAGLRESRAAVLQEGFELIGQGTEPGAVMVRVGEGAQARLMSIRTWEADGATAVDAGDLREPWPVYDDQTGVLVGYEGLDAEGRLGGFFLVPELQRSWSGVRAAFPGDEVRLASWSRDFRKLLVFATRPGSADYHLVDLDTGVARLLAPSYHDPDGLRLDRTGNRAEADIRRAAAIRIADPRNWCAQITEANRELFSRRFAQGKAGTFIDFSAIAARGSQDLISPQ